MNHMEQVTSANSIRCPDTQEGRRIIADPLGLNVPIVAGTMERCHFGEFPQRSGERIRPDHQVAAP